MKTKFFSYLWFCNWFLVMLFGCSVVFYPLSDYVRKHTIVGGIITLLFYGLGIACARLFDNYFQIWNVCKYLMFFYIGFVFRQYNFAIVWGNGRVNNYLLAGMNFVFSILGALFILVILNRNKETRFLISGKNT